MHHLDSTTKNGRADGLSASGYFLESAIEHLVARGNAAGQDDFIATVLREIELGRAAGGDPQRPYRALDLIGDTRPASL
jgi:hypothetical protein